MCQGHWCCKYRRLLRVNFLKKTKENRTMTCVETVRQGSPAHFKDLGTVCKKAPWAHTALR